MSTIKQMQEKNAREQAGSLQEGKMLHIISNVRKALAARGVTMSFTQVAEMLREAGIIDDENRIII